MHYDWHILEMRRSTRRGDQSYSYLGSQHKKAGLFAATTHTKPFIMFFNKQPFLVSITHPIVMVLVESVIYLTTLVLRKALRKMFGAFGSRRIKITILTSDNASLASDMSTMGVEVIVVGPGQHDYVMERMTRHLKEVVWATKHILPFLVPDFMMIQLVTACGNKLNLFPSTATRTDYKTPLEAFTNRKMDLKLVTGEPTFSYCHVYDRTMSNGMTPRTIGCLYAGLTCS
jgi:hypothetical protein